MRKELQIFLTAIMFYTRIPCPRWVDHSADHLNQATRYFPLIGWVVGGTSALVLFAVGQVLPISLAVLISMVVSILITGGFHEDGFADVCDGFGGGWTKEKILTIMKDSVLGAYGVIGIILVLMIKFFSLSELIQQVDLWTACMVLFVAHSLSRTVSVWMIFTDSYVRENEDAKAKPIAKQMSKATFLVANLFGFIPLVLIPKIEILLLIPVLLMVKWYFSRYFKKWIGGYTGDCLGAVQQVAELIIYLTILILWKYI
ncbi:adenosylcobinamide-GDP ribazoletransferase [Reichenbachiella agariperforans]|uniref:adenosylcobinamide-GDP ribazoletransferase n=1 Tax=Reichenbachiella agariperforans TaxID=156994 RepID=UPI001C089C00|nr:adenosylcobinamide-GDP ribazoletransferase [Reichenbachiella agariperforans]MBU2916272.1 adenosylcobinamide-GDP ribazoletransferase [Reichenbachiella agariperforans]